MGDKIYHYTSTSTFMNIFNTKQLWLGGLNETNDINEMFLVKENFKKIKIRQGLHNNCLVNNVLHLI